MRDKKWLKSWRWYATPHSLANRRGVPMFYTFHENPQKQKQLLTTTTKTTKKWIIIVSKNSRWFWENRVQSQWEPMARVYQKHLPMNPKSAWIVGFKVYDLFVAFSKRPAHKKKQQYFTFGLHVVCKLLKQKLLLQRESFFLLFLSPPYSLFLACIFHSFKQNIHKILRIFPPHLIVCISVFDICDLFTWEFFEMVLPRGPIPPFARL